MELRHIDIGQLSVSPANMRVKGRAPDLTNILPSVRARGIIVPLIVRRNGSLGSYEIVAGKRRYHAALAVAQETGEAEPLPCAIMAAGDDAAALEASLIENIARLDPEEVTRWESFTRLVREGRTPDDIALTFGLTELQVKRTLALGNLLPRIRTLYRRGKINAATIRHLTYADIAEQTGLTALRVERIVADALYRLDRDECEQERGHTISPVRRYIRERYRDLRLRVRIWRDRL